MELGSVGRKQQNATPFSTFELSFCWETTLEPWHSFQSSSKAEFLFAYFSITITREAPRPNSSRAWSNFEDGIPNTGGDRVNSCGMSYSDGGCCVYNSGARQGAKRPWQLPGPTTPDEVERNEIGATRRHSLFQLWKRTKLWLYLCWSKMRALQACCHKSFYFNSSTNILSSMQIVRVLEMLYVQHVSTFAAPNSLSDA